MVKVAGKTKGETGTRPGTSGPITKDNYLPRAIAIMRGNGGIGPVIRPDTTPEQWRSWLAYFASIDYPTKYAQKLGIITVPCDWPHQFDAAATTEIPPEPHRHATSRKAAEGLTRLAAELASIPDPYEPPRKGWKPPQTREAAEQRLAELRADTGKRTLSEEAMARMGVRAAGFAP